MKPSEVSRLLTDAAEVDARVRNGAAAVKGWHDLLADDEEWLTYDLAEAARREHQREDSWPLTVADVRARAWDIRRRALAQVRMPDLPAELARDPAGEAAAMRAAEAAALAGRDPAAAMASVAASRRRELNGGPR